MRTIVYEDYSELSVNTARQIAGTIIQKPDALLCFPAGETSVGTFNELIRLNREGKVSFRNCRIVGLDEWLNLDNMRSENCFSFLEKHLFSHIDYSPDNLCFFNGESVNPEKECAETDHFIEKYGPIDMILLGAGMNGHLGLNEPGSSFELYSHIVKIDDTTKRVGQKYFTGHVNLELGVTLGIRHIMEAGTAILQISGKRKYDVVQRLIHSEVSPDYPASALKAHKNSFLLLDHDATLAN
jgi:glucosamine-6-phosphate isomerase